MATTGQREPRTRRCQDHGYRVISYSLEGAQSVDGAELNELACDDGSPKP